VAFASLSLQLWLSFLSVGCFSFRFFSSDAWLPFGFASLGLRLRGSAFRPLAVMPKFSSIFI
jgi:hypothetical protein